MSAEVLKVVPKPDLEKVAAEIKAALVEPVMKLAELTDRAREYGLCIHINPGQTSDGKTVIMVEIIKRF